MLGSLANIGLICFSYAHPRCLKCFPKLRKMHQTKDPRGLRNSRNTPRALRVNPPGDWPSTTLNVYIYKYIYMKEKLNIHIYMYIYMNLSINYFKYLQVLSKAFIFHIILHLTGSRCVQTTPSGCGNDLPELLKSITKTLEKCKQSSSKVWK